MKILKNLLNNLRNSPKKWRNSIPYFLVIGFFAFLWFSPRSDLWDSSRSDLKNQTAKISDQFEGVKLEAKAAYIFDLVKNRPIFELNSEAQLPLASLAKIMTALAVKESFPSSLLVTISKEAVLQEGDEGFIVGEEWPILDLIGAMLISSSNDAAFALASEFNKDFSGDFVSLMNQKAKEIGLIQTYFLNTTGLDLSKNTAGAYGSTKDIAKLLLHIVKKDSSLMEITRLKSVNLHGREFQNTDRVIGDLPGFIAGKTGFSDLAGGNLAVIVDNGFNRPFVIVVLGSAIDGRFNDVKNLFNAAVAETTN